MAKQKLLLGDARVARAFCMASAKEMEASLAALEDGSEPIRSPVLEARAIDLLFTMPSSNAPRLGEMLRSGMIASQPNVIPSILSRWISKGRADAFNALWSSIGAALRRDWLESAASSMVDALCNDFGRKGFDGRPLKNALLGILSTSIAPALREAGLLDSGIKRGRRGAPTPFLCMPIPAEAMEIFIGEGANPDILDSAGKSALWLAAKRGDSKAASALALAGASLRHPDGEPGVLDALAKSTTWSNAQKVLSASRQCIAGSMADGVGEQRTSAPRL